MPDEPKEPDQPKEPDDSARGTNLLASLGGFVAQVAKTPWAALVGVGLVLLLAAFVKNIGGLKLETQGSQVFAFGTAVALIAVGLGGPRLDDRRAKKRLQSVADRPLPAIATDPTFLLKLFLEAMPPAFVKELDMLQPAPDLMQSNALVRAQQSSDRVPHDETLKQIRMDHLAGDKLAAENGASVLLELPAAVIRGKLRPIVTFKTLIEYGGKRYIAGWFVPVEREGISAAEKTVCLRQDAPGQMRFALARDESEDGLTVPVGKAVRASLKAREVKLEPAAPTD
jgi:hypothetical protein